MTTPTPTPFDITPVTIEEEMKRSYLDYAMSVIVSRALPDVRDGLKPVHRRILYGMKEGGYDSTKAFRKSANVVGEVMGKYHPHGDQAIYDAMVRMAQDFSMRLKLVDGQGNFGSMDGDPAAAMRYTEARLAKSAETLLDDIDKETVDFGPNYDEARLEPQVLPARFPNLLVNGAGGIAVGMATNIPPHNLGEVIDACLAYVDDPDISVEQLMEIVPGPDFPTGGVILGRSGIRSAYSTGRGSIVMRGKTMVEQIRKDREAIIVTEIPYQVNKARMIERIAEVVQEKLVEGISDLRDESDRDGVRVVIELKRDAMAEVVLNQLYRFTPLQTSFGVNALALNGGRPEMLSLRDIVAAFVAFREEVITRRTVYELRKARERAHVLVGLLIAVANIDEMIAVIRAAADPTEAREELTSRAWPAADVAPLIELVDEPGRGVGSDGTYRLSDEQARAILDLRLHRLTGLEREKISGDMREVAAKIEEYLAILGDREKLLEVLKAELIDVKSRFDSPRRTVIEDAEFEADIEDLIQREDMVVTVSNAGYVKRVPLSTYRAQRRGGKGRSGMATREEDFVADLFVANTHTPVLFFSSRGMVYKMKVYKLPLGTPQARGKAFVNLLPLAEGETISTIMPLPEDETTWNQLTIMFATAKGYIRPISLSEFRNIYARGLIAIKLEDDDRLVGVRTCQPSDHVLLASRMGKCIRFPIEDLRLYSSRNTVGVRGVKLGEDDEVISLSIINAAEFKIEERDAYLRMANARRRAAGEAVEDGENGNGEANGLSPERFDEMAALEQFILTVTEKGFAKRSSSYEYRVTNRGGQGIWNLELTDKNGPVVASFPVESQDQVMLVTDAGKLIRTPIHDVRIAGRKTQGVTLFRVAEDERVVSVARLSREEAEAEEGDDAGEGSTPSEGGEGA